MRILAVSDDGIRSPGLAALLRALKPLGEVWAAAPSTNQSGRSGSITVRGHLHARKVRLPGLPMGRAFAIRGTPADAVRISILEILPEPPGLVVSGVNAGWNLGPNVFRSGTVMAALEAALLGVPSVAVSVDTDAPAPWLAVSRWTAAILPKIIGRLRGLEVWNLNLPPRPPRGLRLTRPAPPWPDTGYALLPARDGHHRFRIRPETRLAGPRGTDVHAVKAGFASLTRIYPGFIARFR